jgi:hypothetical protein
MFAGRASGGNGFPATGAEAEDDTMRGEEFRVFCGRSLRGGLMQYSHLTLGEFVMQHL